MPADKKDIRKTAPKRSSWENIKVIHHPETLLAVRINRLNVKPHPEYTFEYGYVEADDIDRFHRYQKPKVTIEDGVVEIWDNDDDNDTALRWVKRQAFNFIVAEVQKRENELQLQKKARKPKKKMEEGKRPST